MKITALLFIVLLLWCFQGCLAADFLKAGQRIITGRTNLLVSAKRRFALGFFSPPESPAYHYLGIWWYNEIQESGTQTTVWVANRESPVVDSGGGVFQIADDGNLVVTNTSGEKYWSSNLKGSSSTNRTVVKLMDSGNLVLMDGTSYMWQSFQNPTDTFLPGMKMDTRLELTSWRSDKYDPRRGNFSFKMSGSGYIILQNNKLYWQSAKIGELNLGSAFGDVAFMLSNFSLQRPDSSHQTVPKNFRNTMLLMNSTGQLQFLTRDSFQSDWNARWMAPESFCDIYNSCGNFFSCNVNNLGPCKCLPGFQESEKKCTRKSAAGASSCGERNTTKFLSLVRVKMGTPDEQHPTEKESECKEKCLDKCSKCQAYSYADPINNNDRLFSNCWIWTSDLVTLKEGYFGDTYARNLSLRLNISDIAPTPKTCEPCGTYIVPYPLSTGPDCGDPLYFKFSCNLSTGQLSFFTTPMDTHTVTDMKVDSRTFTIKVDYRKTYCGKTSRSDENLQIYYPFNVTNNCAAHQDKVEVTWQPPLEPICNKSADCEGWKHSSCKQVRDVKRCLCDTNYGWDNISLICTNTKEAVSLPTPNTEPKASEGNSKGQKTLILGITLAGVVIFACAIIFAYVWRRKITRKDKENITRKRGRFYDSERHVKDLIEVEGLEEKDTEGIEVPYFDFESIIVATDNFSDANKLGRGGYGPVYMGKFQDGEVIAVKRLSSVSSQGLQEFKNEVVLIAKLQHRNLVRLRGYCIKGDEKILLYEYMHNKSLDAFIFDPTKSVLLDWQMRFDIILGVARGLLYLHHDSRLRVIHRDMKTSNILLDEEMQPKISDFGLAKIVGGKETEANTERVVGTYGYMSPEYALDGFFSIKSDVFSFGVVMLEIISGKKNTGFYQSNQTSSLLGYAWRLWTENKSVDLMDMTIRESCNANQFIRCAHIGLLCVQDEPNDRPTMSNVVTMLDSETSILPTPKQPTFFASKGLYTTSSSSKPEISLQFEGSTQVEGR